MDIDIIRVGNRIKDRRKELNLSLNDIKRETGISTGALSDIENGKRTPSILIFYAIAQSLKCTADWLISGNSPNSESVTLTISEERLLSGFNKLSKRDQNEILGIINMKLQMQQNEDDISSENREKNNAESSLSEPSNMTSESETA